MYDCKLKDTTANSMVTGISKKRKKGLLLHFDAWYIAWKAEIMFSRQHLLSRFQKKCPTLKMKLVNQKLLLNA